MSPCCSHTFCHLVSYPKIFYSKPPFSKSIWTRLSLMLLWNFGRLTILWETGFPRYWMDQLTPNKGAQCLINKQNSNAFVVTNKIKLQDLISAFLILGFGISLSILCFVIELLLWKIKKLNGGRVTQRFS